MKYSGNKETEAFQKQVINMNNKMEKRIPVILHKEQTKLYSIDYK